MQRPTIVVVTVVVLVSLLAEVPSAQLQATAPRSLFRVFRSGNVGVNMTSCRATCTRWKRGAYVATILTASENAEVAAQVTGLKQVLLGGQRDTTSSPFRWTEGPLGRVNDSRGVVFWTGGAAVLGGECTAAMYCNFDTMQPDASLPTELRLSMFGSTAVGAVAGTWNDVTDGSDKIDGCACRWDPVVFAVLPASSIHLSLSNCRGLCSTWRPGAYVATILTAEDNAMVYALLPSISTFAVVGAERQLDGNGVEATRFRWKQGPLGAMDGGRGALLWTTTNDYTLGSCAQGAYCNFFFEEPNNYYKNQTLLTIYGLALVPLPLRRSRWGDTENLRSPDAQSSCACRVDVPSLSESITSDTTSEITAASKSITVAATASQSVSSSELDATATLTLVQTLSVSRPPQSQTLSPSYAKTASVLCHSGTASISPTSSASSTLSNTQRFTNATGSGCVTRVSNTVTLSFTVSRRCVPAVCTAVEMAAFVSDASPGTVPRRSTAAGGASSISVSRR